MDKPREPHMSVAHQVLSYIKRTPSQGILLHSIGNVELTGYCDANWARCKDTRRSVIGYFVMLGNAPVSWKTKKQQQYPDLVLKLSIVPWLHQVVRSHDVEIYLMICVSTTTTYQVILR